MSSSVGSTAVANSVMTLALESSRAEPITPPRKRALDAGSDKDAPPTKKVKLNPHLAYWDNNDQVIIHLDGVSFKLPRKKLELEGEWFQHRFSSEPDESPNIFIVPDLGVTSAQFTSLLNVMINYFDLCYVLYDDYNEHRLIDVFIASKALGFHRYQKWAASHLAALWPAELVRFPALPQRKAKLCWSMILFSFSHDFPSIRKQAAYELVRHSQWWEACCDHDARAESNFQSYSCLFATYIGLSEVWKKSSQALPLPSCDALSHSNSTFSEEYQERMYDAEDSVFKKHPLNPLQGWKTLIDTTWGRNCCSACVGRMKDVWRTKREELFEKMGEWVRV